MGYTGGVFDAAVFDCAVFDCGTISGKSNAEEYELRKQILREDEEILAVLIAINSEDF